MNSTNTSSDYDYTGGPEPVSPCQRQADNLLGAQLSTQFYFMFLFSLLSNGLLLFIIYRFEKQMTVTNILLLNLVFSSLIFMSSLPFLGVYMQMQTWIFGRAMCKLVGSVYYLGFYSSVLFLALLTFDRHLAVVYSLGAAHVRNTTYAVISVAVVWLVSSLACIQPMILQNTFVYGIDNKTYCQEHAQDLSPWQVQQLKTSEVYIQLFLFYIFPLAVIVYCYVRIAIRVLSSKIVTKFKTVRLILVIVLLFFLCWTPYNIIQLLTLKKHPTCDELRKRGKALHITKNLAYMYFCISPIFYTFVGKKFQNYFRQLLVKRFPRINKHISVIQISKSNMSTKSTQNELHATSQGFDTQPREM